MPSKTVAKKPKDCKSTKCGLTADDKLDLIIVALEGIAKRLENIEDKLQKPVDPTFTPYYNEYYLPLPDITLNKDT